MLCPCAGLVATSTVKILALSTAAFKTGVVFRHAWLFWPSMISTLIWPGFGASAPRALSMKVPNKPPTSKTDAIICMGLPTADKGIQSHAHVSAIVLKTSGTARHFGSGPLDVGSGPLDDWVRDSATPTRSASEALA